MIYNYNRRKDMKKGSIIRIVTWGTIALLLLLFGISGLVLFKSGHGKIGSIIKETEPLVSTFNNLKGLEQFKNAGISIKAKAKGNTVVVSYNTEVSTASFTFKYNNDSGVRLLTMKYNIVDNTIASVITKYMIDAIAVTRGYTEGKVFDKFIMSDFENTTPAQGVSIKTVNNITTVILNMDKSILDSNIENEDDVKYITIEQATTIVKDLKDGTNVMSKSNGLTLHINMYSTYYTIYIRDDKEIYSKGMYESLKSIIYVLSGPEKLNEFVLECPTLDNENYDNADSNIKITYDSTGANAYTEFTSTNKVLQVDIKTTNNNISSQ